MFVRWRIVDVIESKIVYHQKLNSEDELYAGSWVALDKSTNKIYPITIRKRYIDNERSRRTGEAIDADFEYHPEDLKKVYGYVIGGYNGRDEMIPVEIIFP